MELQKQSMSPLYIRGLSVTYKGRWGSVRALRDVDLHLRAGQITAVIGESGSGKTTLGRTLLGALPESAHVTYESFEVPRRIAFVQQEATASLHPLLSIGQQISDVMAARQKEVGHRLSRRELNDATVRMLHTLGLRPAQEFYRRYPHQLSGGQAQRASLARALALQADLIVADEPTSQLDLVTQAEAVKLLHRITKEHEIYTLFITHRLALVAEMADTVVVLHEGQVVEHGPVVDVWTRPQHPYTKSLLQQMTSPSIESTEPPSVWPGVPGETTKGRE